MSHTVNLLHRLGKDEDGASLIEYTVLVAILLIAVIATIGTSRRVSLSRILRVAPNPSRVGKLMSIKIRLGNVCVATATASSPLLAVTTL